MRFVFLFFFLLSACVITQGQSLTDTSELEEVVVKAYFSDQPLLRLPGSVSVIGSSVFKNQPPYSLVPSVNTAPGVRMEERSPGSYRLSIRGSLLRSPYGIRNVKIYMDDFLLTDAGGNTYLNLLDAASVGRIEILKGPEGSIFGANSGGVVLIHSKSLVVDSTAVSAGATAGAFGLFHQNLTAQTRNKDFALTLNQSFQRSDGYRENSSMNRKSIQLMPEWNYSKSAQVKALIMYSDLQYQTPGGLTFAQFELDPRMARPGASDQQAAIYNETILAGISHSKSITPKLKHVISVTGAVTDFVNPFITNYETRDENSLGLRTYFELLSRAGNWNMQLGAELQRTTSEYRNYKNLKGQPDEKLDFVDFRARQRFLFTRFSWQPTEKLTMEAATSLNFYQYNFKGIYPVSTPKETRSFKPQLMPRVAASYMLSDFMVLRASVSRGYSAPTTEEVRPSNLVVNKELEPESGWNYESGLRLSLLNNRIYFDGVVFHYDLKDAIVRRVEAADAEFYVNAGGTSQTGFEAQLNAWLVSLKSSGFFRGARLSEAYTASNFRFSDYIVEAVNFSGNKLTGVPQNNLVSSVELRFPLNLNLYVQHNYISSIPLNDANTIYADKYHLLQAKLSWQTKVKKINIKVFIGGDNLLDTRYSLGNDLNVRFGSRFFNPAASRNYHGGISAQF